MHQQMRAPPAWRKPPKMLIYLLYLCRPGVAADCGFMSRVVWTALVISCLFLQTPVLAASITVNGDSPLRSITVTIENATVDLVLEDLSKKYGFQVGGLQNVNKGDPLSATMTGSLQSVLGRLLRNWNHMIVQSSDNDRGIVKVMILDSAYGAPPPTGVTGNAPNKPLLQAPFLRFPIIRDRAAPSRRYHRPVAGFESGADVRPPRARGWGIGG
jgi:hypothetical protein